VLNTFELEHYTGVFAAFLFIAAVVKAVQAFNSFSASNENRSISRQQGWERSGVAGMLLIHSLYFVKETMNPSPFRNDDLFGGELRMWEPMLFIGGGFAWALLLRAIGRFDSRV
jgi:hypothetical protein